MNSTPSPQKESAKKKVKPSKILIWFLTGLFGVIIILESLSLMGVSVPLWSYQIWKIALAILFIATITDVLSLKTLKSPTIHRTLPDYLPLNQWSQVSLLFINENPYPVKFNFFDHLPHYIEFNHLPQSVDLDQNQYLIKYPIRPLRRGHFYWDICEITMPSRWGLWEQRRHIKLTNEARVYPDFTRLYGAHLSTIEQWIHHLGVRPQPRRGLGQNFQQLREFREGDTLRQIDWKATARHRFPITKEYQDERDQQIIFVLDCGQRMRIKEGELSHFDHALNATLLLSYVALKQDDAVGLTTFSAKNNIEIKPKKGIQHLNTLLNSVYNLECTRNPADYNEAINTLLTKVKRRSLIIILTNLRYDENDETLKAFRMLTRRHKVLIASLREEVVDDIRTAPIYDLSSALTYCGNIQHNLQRTELHERLLANHLPIIESLPTEFAPQLINHYLALKRSGAF